MYEGYRICNESVQVTSGFSRGQRNEKGLLHSTSRSAEALLLA